MATEDDLSDPLLDATLQALNVFAREFMAESDRAAVVLGAAKLDYLLYDILDAFLLPGTTGTDELLDGDRPLATFSARISLCARLGLIAPDFAKALHLVRRIRNDFAHEPSGVSLTTGSHRDRIDALFRPMRQWEGALGLLKTLGADTPSTRFRAAVTLMSARLTGLLHATERIQPPSTAGLTPKRPTA